MKSPPADAEAAGDAGLIPGWGRSPGRINPLQNSCLGNPMDQRSLVGYGPWGLRVRHDLATDHIHARAVCISCVSSL